MNVAQMNLKKVINASGKMSILGVSTISDDVLEAMKIGASNFYEMDQLYEESGKIVSRYMGTETAIITNSASAAIALAVAGFVTQGDTYLVERLPSVPLTKEIIIMKGHMIDYGAPVSTMIQLGRGLVKEVGYANGCSLQQIEAAITEQTIGIIFIQSHHTVQKNMPNLHDVSKLAYQKQIPLILDIAAEENIAGYAELAEVIIVSGSKAIEGPTSGILAGRKKYVTFAKQHLQGIGRAMKIGKESILGLLKALENFPEHKMSKQEQMIILDCLMELEKINGVKVSVHQDESGRDIYRARIQIDETSTKLSAVELTKSLRNGNIAIYTRDYYANIGYFDIDPRALSRQDVEYIVTRIKQLLGV